MWFREEYLWMQIKVSKSIIRNTFKTSWKQNLCLDPTHVPLLNKPGPKSCTHTWMHEAKTISCGIVSLKNESNHVNNFRKGMKYMLKRLEQGDHSGHHLYVRGISIYQSPQIWGRQYYCLSVNIHFLIIKLASYHPSLQKFYLPRDVLGAPSLPYFLCFRFKNVTTTLVAVFVFVIVIRLWQLEVIAKFPWNRGFTGMNDHVSLNKCFICNFVPLLSGIYVLKH